LRLGLITQTPRLLCVQEDTCAPIARAWLAGHERFPAELVVPAPKGIARALHRDDPSAAYPYMRRILLESSGDCAMVTAAEIRSARDLLGQNEGIAVCYSAAAALAGLIGKVDQGLVRRTDTILINLTGRDRQPEASDRTIHWLKSTAAGWVPEDPHDEFA